MPQHALQRTIRRCAAVLAIPLSLYPMVFVASLEMNERYDHSFRNILLELGDELALIVLLGAILYLVGSVLTQVAGTDTTPDNANSAD